jgi:hypothetical protein
LLDLNIFLSKIGIARFPFRFAHRAGGRFSVSRSQYLRYIAQTVYLTPLIIGFAAASLFAAVPQMQEVYLGIIEDVDYGRGVAGLAAVSLFSALIYAWNHLEVSGRIDAIYPDHADIYFDRRVFDVRDLKTAFAASLPFFGIFIGLAQVYRHVLDAGETGLARSALKALPGLPNAVIAAAAITLAAYIALLALYYRFRKKTNSQKRILHLCYALAAVLVAAPIFAPDTTLIASRLAGPLAITAFVLTELAVALRLLFWFLQTIFRVILALPSLLLMLTDRLPLGLRQTAVGLVPLVAVGMIAFGIIRAGGGGVEGQSEETPAIAGGDLASTFHAWLAERKTGSSRYAVFVVAAQGGGIYAASTAGAFLATMQDHCPAFARHVFAISAVSGGSVGASLFNAAFADSVARGTNRKAAVDVEPGCDRLFAKPGELSRRLRAITQDDHISPVLAYLVPDFLRGFVLSRLRSESAESERKSPCDNGNSAWGSRDLILEKSFIDSFKRTVPSNKGADEDCPSQKERNLLARPFSDAWSQGGDLPALLLNATWVETGYRVAFAPFALQALGGGTLYSFDNLSNTRSDPTLIKAAVISARFPGLMPPWAFSLDKGSHLTFVDGGYADSSGVATAFQLYNKLKQIAGDDVDLYLIALTDKSKALTAASGVEPVGSMPVRSWLYDFISPVTTLLSVRDLQSRKAVTEARTALGEKMIVVQLDQKAFPLPLGWKLSGLSSDIIRLTIGDPERCATGDEKGNTALSIANRNSCELKRIVDLISQKTITSQSLFAKPDFVSPKLDVASPKPDNVGSKSVVASPRPDVTSPKSDVASSKPAAPKALGAWAPTSQ